MEAKKVEKQKISFTRKQIRNFVKSIKSDKRGKRRNTKGAFGKIKNIPISYNSDNMRVIKKSNR